MARPKPQFREGDKVSLTQDAIDNYGEQYADTTYTVEQWYDHYAPASSSDPHGHPGFDDVGQCLYHLNGFNFDLYDWELRSA